METLDPPSAALNDDAGKATASELRRWRVGTLSYTFGGIIVLFCWLLWGDFAWSMKERSIAAVGQLVLKKFGASDMLVGLLMVSLPNAIAMILGPIISYRSDRYRSRWGRRIPFLVATTPIVVFGIIGMAFSPLLGQLLGKYGPPGGDPRQAVLLFFGLFWVCFEFGTIASNAVFSALINDVVPQEFLGRFFGMFRALSLMAGILFNYFLMGKAETHYLWMFVGIGTLYGIGFSIMCLKVKEGGYPPMTELPLRRPLASGFFGAVKIYCRDCFSNSYYLWVFASATLAALAFAPFNTFALFYAKSVNMSMDNYGKYMALTFVISLVLAYFLGVLADRFHPLRLGIATLTVYLALMLWGGCCVTGEKTYAIALVAHGVVSGTFFTATASLSQRLFPRSTFAQFASAQGIVLSSFYMLVAPCVGSFLDYTGHVYRYTFFIGVAMSLLALLASLILYRKFKALGGVKNYRAPEVE